MKPRDLLMAPIWAVQVLSPAKSFSNNKLIGSRWLNERGLHTWALAPNTLVVADTSGFHGRTPADRPVTRLELYGTLRRNPFNPLPDLDIAALPGIKGRLNRRLDQIERCMRSLGLRASGWTDVGPKRPGDPPSV